MDFKDYTIQGLLSIFFNFKIDKNNKDIVVSANCRYSKYAESELNEDICESNNELLSSWSNIKFENKSTKKSYKSEYRIINNSEYTSDEIAKKIYREIQNKRILIKDTDFERMILLSLFSLRGSADPTTNYYSVDLTRDVQSKYYLELVLKLLTNIDDLRQLNFNFRELQEDYVDNGKNRNTQIRINLKYLMDKINYDISYINIYKQKIIDNLKEEIKKRHYNYSIEIKFIERLLLYKEKILDNNTLNIHRLREKLGFSLNFETQEKGRNISIVNIAREIYPDECVCCKDKYSLDDRTFKMRKNNRYYLEIHHVVSFASDKKGDQIDNLVKVCPTCHRALTKNRAEEIYQKELIRNILKNSSFAKDYVSNFVLEDDLDSYIAFVYNNLQ